MKQIDRHEAVSLERGPEVAKGGNLPPAIAVVVMIIAVAVKAQLEVSGIKKSECEKARNGEVAQWRKLARATDANTVFEVVEGCEGKDIANISDDLKVTFARSLAESLKKYPEDVKYLFGND